MSASKLLPAWPDEVTNAALSSLISAYSTSLAVHPWTLIIS